MFIIRPQGVIYLHSTFLGVAVFLGLLVGMALFKLALTKASRSFLRRSASVFLSRMSSSPSLSPSSDSRDLWLQVGQNLGGRVRA